MSDDVRQLLKEVAARAAALTGGPVVLAFALPDASDASFDRVHTVRAQCDLLALEQITLSLLERLIAQADHDAVQEDEPEHEDTARRARAALKLFERPTDDGLAGRSAEGRA